MINFDLIGFLHCKSKPKQVSKWQKDFAQQIPEQRALGSVLLKELHENLFYIAT